MNTDDLVLAHERLNGACGLPAWGAIHSVGSMISLEFGAQRPDDPSHGAYTLFVYQAAWRWETADRILLSSEDPARVLRDAVSRMNQLTLTAVRVETPSLSARFDFDDGSRLRTFTIHTSAEDGMEHWMMFLPDDQVFAAGPGGEWSLGPAGDPEKQPEAGS